MILLFYLILHFYYFYQSLILTSFDIHTIDLYRNLSKISIESVRILKDENVIIVN